MGGQSKKVVIQWEHSPYLQLSTQSQAKSIDTIVRVSQECQATEAGIVRLQLHGWGLQLLGLGASQIRVRLGDEICRTAQTCNSLQNEASQW